MEEVNGASMSKSLAHVRDTISKYQEQYPAVARHVTVMGASKTQPPEVIASAIVAGITDFGENRVQEAEAKWPALKAAYPQVRLHLIGPLQTNKVKQAVALFDVIQTVDRPKLAQALAQEMVRTGRRLPCFIQVNIGKESQKAGVMPEEVGGLMSYCKTIDLPVQGLMCVPPHNQPPAPHFAMLREMAKQYALPKLSMGMSEDYETAIRLGSTCIRLGRVLFGERN